MIGEKDIQEIVEYIIQDTDYFLIDVSVKPGNRINVVLDRFSGINIDHCADISRKIENELDTNEAFELQVSSPGLTEAFKVFEQYQKNLGKQVKVIFYNGTVKQGTLEDVNERGIKLKENPKKAKKGKPAPIKNDLIKINFSDIKATKLIIDF